MYRYASRGRLWQLLLFFRLVPSFISRRRGYVILFWSSLHESRLVHPLLVLCAPFNLFFARSAGYVCVFRIFYQLSSSFSVHVLGIFAITFWRDLPVSIFVYLGSSDCFLNFQRNFSILFALIAFLSSCFWSLRWLWKIFSSFRFVFEWNLRSTAAFHPDIGRLRHTLAFIIETRDSNRIACSGYLRCSMHTLKYEWPLWLSERRKKRSKEKRTGNNQRADSADEWDSGSEDIVRSIDGIGVCNVNWLAARPRTDRRDGAKWLLTETWPSSGPGVLISFYLLSLKNWF